MLFWHQTAVNTAAETSQAGFAALSVHAENLSTQLLVCSISSYTGAEMAPLSTLLVEHTCDKLYICISDGGEQQDCNSLKFTSTKTCTSNVYPDDIQSLSAEWSAAKSCLSKMTLQSWRSDVKLQNHD